MTRLIQIADDHGTDTDIVRLVGTGDDELVPLFTYLISDDGNERFFLQISAPNRNLSRFSPRPFDVIALSQMLALIEERGYAKESLVSHVRFYEAEIIAHLDDNGTPQTPFTRPSTGGISRPSTTEEIIRCLSLPGAENDQNVKIGKLARSGEATVPINITEHIINHHILVAGSTGSGKSHLLSNLAHVADAMGRCIILFDHKPDHQNHHETNPDSDSPRSFRIGESGDRSGGIVRYWTLDQSDTNPYAQILSLSARDLDPEILGGTVFHRAGEENQAETFAAIASAYADQQQQQNPNWTIWNLIDFVRNNDAGKIKGIFGEADVPLHSSTLATIKRKLFRPGSRIPSFIDARSELGPLGEPKGRVGQIREMFHPGLNVVRIAEDDKRGYALFLSHLLQQAVDTRAGDVEAPRMLMIIDEAADIFRADSRYLKNAATGMLAERIRKGRSLHIGYVIAVQDAGDVPENIRHNLNTTIVGRHRHLGTLREALPTVRESFLANADKLRPGEMLVDLFGVPSLLLVKMDISRSKLTVTT